MNERLVRPPRRPPHDTGQRRPSEAMTQKERWERNYFRLQHAIVPGLKYSQRIYEEVLEEYVTVETNWLDAGCGHQLLPEWRREQEAALVRRARFVAGVDLDLEGVSKHRSITARVLSDLQALPFADESFDLITCNMVVEHLTHPGAVFREFHRTLRPAGRVIIHTPNLLGYSTALPALLPRVAKLAIARALQEREPADVFRTYYRANSMGRLNRSLCAAGFHQEQFLCLVTTGQLYFSKLLALLELLYVRMLMKPSLKRLRTNLLCVYAK
jgi:2-polyprenyl-3-methyl-5-hydroxy-6-metoxy-1,4-benzoquinol methylase